MEKIEDDPPICLKKRSGEKATSSRSLRLLSG